MREIKYKVYCKRHKREEIYTLGDLICGLATMVNGEGGEFEHWREYTGLKDKNGKEIYEGDIIQYEDIHKGVVEYSEQYAQYVLSETGQVADEYEPLGDYSMEVFEVVR